MPEVFISDNVPQYKSPKFSRSLSEFSITDVTSSQRYPLSNGESERAAQTVKAMLRKEKDPYVSMLSHHSATLRNGFRPSELMLGRKLRTSLPVNPTELVSKWPGGNESRRDVRVVPLIYA